MEASLKYMYIVLTACFIWIKATHGGTNDTAIFNPVKQTIEVSVCQPLSVSLKANINLMEAAIRVERYNPMDYDYYYLFFKRSGDRRIRENKKTGSLGHYPRYKPYFEGDLFRFSISRVVEEDAGMYVISLQSANSETWQNSYITVVVKEEDKIASPSKLQNIKDGEELVTTTVRDDGLEVDIIQPEKYCDFFIITAILLLIGAAAKVALLYYLYITKRELNQLKRETSLDRKGLLPETDKGYPPNLNDRI